MVRSGDALRGPLLLGAARRTDHPPPLRSVVVFGPGAQAARSSHAGGSRSLPKGFAPGSRVCVVTRFALGQVVTTPGALELVGHEGVYSLLSRHASGDWGALDAHDRRENSRALKTGARIFSAYETPKGVRPAGKLWIITEADRSSTCILLPSEY